MWDNVAVSDFDFNTKSLDGLIKALKGNMSKARVGILGSGQTARNKELEGARGHANETGRSVNAARKAPKSNYEVATNAAIGAVHEFGGPKMPQRSFLRVPISQNLQKYLENSGAFGKDELARVIKEASLLPWLKRIATVAETIVHDAFDTGGFGKWAKWKTKGYENNTGQILVDTQQLRNSITSDVK